MNIHLLRKHFSFQDPKQEVAFTAAVTSLSTTWNSGTLMFDVIITNVGNGYNPRSGVFTSPGKGTYVFYVSALEYSQQYLGLEIVLNNVSKVRLIGESAAAYHTSYNFFRVSSSLIEDLPIIYTISIFVASFFQAVLFLFFYNPITKFIKLTRFTKYLN